MSEASTHNKNCFAYLEVVFKHQPGFLQGIAPNLCLDDSSFESYQEDICYGNLYSSLLWELENQLSNSESPLNQYLTPEKKKEETYRTWINAFFDNPNNNLLTSYEPLRVVLQLRRLTDGSIQNVIQRALNKKEDPNHTNPKTNSNWLSRFFDNFGPNFKPVLTTGLASVIDYQHRPDNLKELRLTTQAERHWGLTRVNPIFREWLEVNQKPEDEITHVYFNLLKRDCPLGLRDPAALNESWFTAQLEPLEQLSTNLAVITLPAHRGIFDEHSTFNEIKNQTKQSIIEEFCDIAEEKPGINIKDFHLSPQIRAKLYAGMNEREKLEELVNNSFSALKLTKKNYLSFSQKQALWFYFTKFEFPNFVLETLSPKTFNFTCKHGIDRGAITSSFYNLIASIQNNTPLTRDEFERANHAAAAMVMGRGLNEHHSFLFNALDHYLRNNKKTILQNPRLSWLIDWLHDNTPHQALTHKRIKRAIKINKKRIEAAVNDEPLKKQAFDIFNLIEEQLFHQNEISPLSGRRLMLDSVSTISKCLLEKDNPTHKIKLQDLSKEIKKVPTLIAIWLPLQLLISSLLSWLPVKGLKDFHTQCLGRYNAYIRHHVKRVELSDNLASFFQPSLPHVIASEAPQSIRKDDTQDDAPHFIGM